MGLKSLLFPLYVDYFFEFFGIQLVLKMSCCIGLVHFDFD